MNGPGFLAASLSTRQVVGIAEMKVSNREEEVLVTHALGSCLGVCIHDPVAGVGGILHAMLPSASADPDKARTNPARFVDSGVTALFKTAYERGARKERIVVKVAGGASMGGNGGTDSFRIGQRNIVALRKLFWKNGVLISGEDVGGSCSRTLSLDMATGEVRLRVNGTDTIL
jgi:chemotaxis protein CheD